MVLPVQVLGFKKEKGRHSGGPVSQLTNQINPFIAIYFSYLVIAN